MLVLQRLFIQSTHICETWTPVKISHYMVVYHDIFLVGPNGVYIHVAKVPLYSWALFIANFFFLFPAFLFYRFRFQGITEPAPGPDAAASFALSQWGGGGHRSPRDSDGGVWTESGGRGSLTAATLLPSHGKDQTGELSFNTTILYLRSD